MSEINPEDIISDSPPKIRLNATTFAEIAEYSIEGYICLIITVHEPPIGEVKLGRIHYLHLGQNAWHKLVEFLNIHGGKTP